MNKALVADAKLMKNRAKNKKIAIGADLVAIVAGVVFTLELKNNHLYLG